MFKVAVCEDESLQLEINSLFINKWAKENSIPIKISNFKSGEEFIIKNDEDFCYDCILIDIKMKKMDGIELARIIREKNSDVSIIFVSALNEYIEYGYDFNAVHFLVKPIQEGKLFKSLDRAYALKKKKNKNSCLIIKKAGEIIRLKKDSIVYCESFNHYIDIHTTEEDINVKKKMSDLEQELESYNFVRVHRSYIINMDYAKQMIENSIIMENDIEIPISKKRKSEVKDIYIKSF